MNGVNIIHLVGNLVFDPEVRETGSGKEVANLQLATNYNGNASFHRLVAWGSNAKFAKDYLKKGELLYVMGRLDYRKWDKGGVEMTSAEIVVDRIQGLGSRDRGSTGHTEAPKDHVDGNRKEGVDDGFDSIPF